MKVSVTREAVLDILSEYDDSENAKFNIILNNVLAKVDYLDERDKAFIGRLARGCMERRITLDYVIDKYAQIGNKKMKMIVRNILRMGIYQILYMDGAADFAACNEAVNLTICRGLKGLSSFVNGVLRKIAREKNEIAWPDKENPDSKVWYYSVFYSVPGWIVKYLLKNYGEQRTEIILQGLLADRKIIIRVDERLGEDGIDELKNEIERSGVSIKAHPYSKYAFVIEGATGINSVPGFEDGRFTVQDVSSQLCIELAGIKKGCKVLDMCGAPGGKTVHAAVKTGEKGSVVSCDISGEKTELIAQNVSRMRIENTEILVSDATVFRPDFVKQFDVVICDAPCSGLGVMGRKPDIRYSVTMQGVKNLASLQREILNNAVQYVKKGGTLVYSTCTITHEENEDNRNYLLNELGLKPKKIDFDIRMADGSLIDTAAEGYISFLPGINECDGFFISTYTV